jgi:hypothetical protein
MVSERPKYLISDMAVAHLLTWDEMWSPLPWAYDAYVSGELMTFTSKAEANRYVTRLRKQGGHTQTISSVDVPWRDPGMIDQSGDSIDWTSIKDLVQNVLEVAKEHEDTIRNAASDDGKSYEDFLAAAITMLIEESLDGTL